METSSRRIDKLVGHVAAQNQNVQQTNEFPFLRACDTSASNSEPSVKYEVLPGRIALITLNRPSRGNGFTREMQERYQDMLDRANSDSNVGAIIVTGAGKMFSVGADKDDLTTIGPKDNAKASASVPSYHRDVAQVNALELDKPVICVVNGACAGLGLVVACMADIRFATKNAKFTTAFAKRGLLAEHGVSWVLPRIVGMSNAMDLLLSSRLVLSDEAHQMGLVNRVYPDQESCMKAAIDYATEMVRFCSPAAMSEIRRQVYCSWGQTPREDSLKAESLMKKSFKHPDFAEGVASLVEKRDPKFQGLKAGFVRDIK